MSARQPSTWQHPDTFNPPDLLYVNHVYHHRAATGGVVLRRSDVNLLGRPKGGFAVTSAGAPVRPRAIKKAPDLLSSLAVMLYEVLAPGYHSPLTKTQIAELFRAGRVGR